MNLSYFSCLRILDTAFLLLVQHYLLRVGIFGAASAAQVFFGFFYWESHARCVRAKLAARR
ncbi:hypothetical protein, partial [Pseudomonas avellanae]|uniref:hypothetical protein n=1 Tax=Pseudomonas avellanae TaxID=46257 RepID=UPI001ED987E4